MGGQGGKLLKVSEVIILKARFYFLHETKCFYQQGGKFWMLLNDGETDEIFKQKANILNMYVYVSTY